MLPVFSTGLANGHATSALVVCIAAVVVAVGMPSPPLVPDRVWRFLCWSAGIAAGLYALQQTFSWMPSGAVLVVLIALVVLLLGFLYLFEAQRDRAPTLPPEPDPTVNLSIESAYDETVLICVGVLNPRIAHIDRVTLNFLVPDFVTELVPADQHATRLAKPRDVKTSAEQLLDGDGNPVGESVKYWQRNELSFAGRVSSVQYFRVTMKELQPFPVKLVLVSPDLREPIEIRQMIHPPRTRDEYPEPFRLDVDVQELTPDSTLLHLAVITERGRVADAVVNVWAAKPVVSSLHPADSVGNVQQAGQLIDTAQETRWVFEGITFRDQSQKDFWFLVQLPRGDDLPFALRIGSDDLDAEFQAEIRVPRV